ITLRRQGRLDQQFAALIGRHWAWPGMDGGPACKLVIDKVVAPQDIPTEYGVCVSWSGLSFWLVGAPKLFQALCGFDPWLGKEVASPETVEPGWPLREVVSVLNNFLFNRPADWVQPVAEMGLWSARASHSVAIECSIWAGQGMWLDTFWLVPVEVERVGAFVSSLMNKSGLAPRSLAALPDVPVYLPIDIGQASMPLSQLHALRVGDVVCFSRPLLIGQDRLQIEFSGGKLDVRIIDERHLVVDAPAVFSKTKGEASMDEELKMGELSLDGAGPGVALPTKSSVLDVPVTLSALAGSVTLSVAALGALKAGDTIDLDEPARALVRLVANGKEIGLGELVDVDGKLGVQISRWDLSS
ncbi:MAG: hypothetical protein RIR70_357, partial [Pseudomonadota bacterium]